MLFKLSADNGNIVCKELYLPDFFLPASLHDSGKKMAGIIWNLRQKCEIIIIYIAFFISIYIF